MTATIEDYAKYCADYEVRKERFNDLMNQVVLSGDFRTITSNKVITKEVVRWFEAQGLKYTWHEVRNWLVDNAPEEAIGNDPTRKY